MTSFESALEKLEFDKIRQRILRYAASDPGGESFPEAFSLYKNDPEWMKNNLPDLFTWFETVKTTGKPPITP